MLAWIWLVLGGGAGKGQEMMMTREGEVAWSSRFVLVLELLILGFICI